MATMFCRLYCYCAMAVIKWLEMSVARQLYQLQEIDLELDSNEQSLNQTARQLGESEIVVRTRQQLELERQHLEELAKQQRSVEWEIDDITSKLTTAEEALYSGRIRNPKELANLQHETDALKARRRQLEDNLLEIMGQVEFTSKSVAAINSELKVREAEWQSQQQQLSAHLEQLKATRSELNEQRKQLIGLLMPLDPKLIDLYTELKKHKRTAVAKVEQGICQGCRISLPVTELQRARGNSLVRCSSCGRILFLA